MKKTSLRLSCLLLCLLPSLAGADSFMQVEINKGKRVTLSAPAASIVAANPDIADVQVVSPRLIYIYGKHIGQTSIFAVDANDKTIFDSTVEVTHNISDLERSIQRIAPNSDVGIKTVDGGLVLDGYANTPDESAKISSVTQAFLGDKDKVINMIKTNGSDQVMLKVKIVEMARTDLKNLGINLQNVTNTANFSLQLLQGNNMTFFGPQPNTNYYLTPGSLLNRGGSTDSNLMLRYQSLSGIVDALETQGLASILAEPTLTTTSGKAASFLAGGEFPVTTTSSLGSVNVQYQTYGVSLNFTPVVMSKDRMSILVAPEVSSLDFDNPVTTASNSNPIILTRRAQSTVEMGSGDTFVLAGLIQNNRNNTISKFPGLGDVPILGELFRSQQFQNDQTELVILVTPFIVHPATDATKLQTPDQGYVPPSDFQRLLFGNLYQETPMDDEKDGEHPKENATPQNDKKTDSPMPPLHGEGGFIME